MGVAFAAAAAAKGAAAAAAATAAGVVSPPAIESADLKRKPEKSAAATKPQTLSPKP